MKTGLLLFTLLRGLDLGTTHAVLAQHGLEANPFLPQRPVVNLAVGAGLTVGQIVGLRELHKSHQTLAKWVLVAGIAAEGFAVSHNVRELRK